MSLIAIGCATQEPPYKRRHLHSLYTTWTDNGIADRVGDVLVVTLDEELASNDSSGGLIAAFRARFPDIEPTKLFASSEQRSPGSGLLEGRHSPIQIVLRIRQIRPNGDLYVEGTKVVMVGHREHHIYVSGLVHPADLAADNTVPSSRISEPEIEIRGMREQDDSQRRLTRAASATPIVGESP